MDNNNITKGKEKEIDDENDKNIELKEISEESDRKILDLMNEGQYIEASELLSRKLESHVLKFGELSEKCLDSYLEYGNCLVKLAQKKGDVLGGGVSEAAGLLDNIKSQIGGSSSLPQYDDSDDDSDDDDDSNNDNNDNDNEEAQDDFYEEAWEILEVARVIAEKHFPESMRLSEVYSSIAELSLESDNLTQAIDDYNKCLEIRIRILSPEDRSLAEIHYSLGLAYSHIKDSEKKASIHYEKALDILEKNKQKEKNKVKIEELDEIIADLRLRIEEVEDPGVSMPSSSSSSSSSSSNSNPFLRATTENAAGGYMLSSTSNSTIHPNSNVSRASSGVVTNFGVVGNVRKRSPQIVHELIPKKKKPNVE